MRSDKSSDHLRGKLAMSVRHGFTLVELLVVIAIIGILMGIAVPAIFGVIGTAKSAKQRLEIGAIEQAIERYQEKYGDYPPDFSDWTIVERHYRKIFPRIANDELTFLQRLLDADVSNDGDFTKPIVGHDPQRMDRAEAIVWVLGGYSSNPIQPFTGDGGPLSLIPNSLRYQINVDRDNKLYEFDFARLDLEIENKDQPISDTNYYKSSDSTAVPDLFAHYAAGSGSTPFVYFDSRTYAVFGTGVFFNRYVNPLLQDDSVRPYLSEVISVDNELVFCNPDSFQILGPGLDSLYGYASTSLGPADPRDGTRGLWYVFPTGVAKAFRFARGNLFEEPLSGGKRYQELAAFERIDHPHMDNLSNFADGKLIDELEE